MNSQTDKEHVRKHAPEGHMRREPPHVLIESIRKLIRREAAPNLIKVIGKTHPADIAILIRRLSDREGQILFGLLEGPERAAETLSELDPEMRINLLDGMAIQRIVEIMRAMDPDDRADTIGSLPEEMAEEILAILRQDESEAVECPWASLSGDGEYFYLPPAAGTVGSVIVACDLEDNHEGIGRGVLLSDGNARWLQEAEFQEMLALSPNAAFAKALAKALAEAEAEGP